jgi:ABC-type amino acid transport substrate-binding protein
MWGLSVTEERLKNVDMIVYAGDLVSEYPLLFWNHIPSHVHSIEDCGGMTVCVEPGSTQEKVLNRYPHVVQKPTEKVIDALFDIRFGKAGAACVEPAVAQKFLEKFPSIKVLNIPLSSEDRVFGIGIAIRKNVGSLKEKLQDAISILKAGGRISIYEKKWGLT